MRNVQDVQLDLILSRCTEAKRWDDVTKIYYNRPTAGFWLL